MNEKKKEISGSEVSAIMGKRTEHGVSGAELHAHFVLFNFLVRQVGEKVLFAYLAKIGLGKEGRLEKRRCRLEHGAWR